MLSMNVRFQIFGGVHLIFSFEVIIASTHIIFASENRAFVLFFYFESTDLSHRQGLPE